MKINYYNVRLLDKDGYIITEGEYCGLVRAKEQAKHWISDDYAQYGAETTHEVLGTEKVEIINDKGECVWDKFYDHQN